MKKKNKKQSITVGNDFRIYDTGGDTGSICVCFREKRYASVNEKHAEGCGRVPVRRVSFQCVPFQRVWDGYISGRVLKGESLFHRQSVG